MKANVRIEMRERGKLVDVREGHNIFLERGRIWLAQMIGLVQHLPDTPTRSDRIRYMGVGVGGKEQSNISVATTAPITTLYPAGSDPEASGGNDYDDTFPVSPIINTLERPVKITGSTTDPYATAPASDVWLIDTPNFFTTHLTLTEATFHGRLEASDVNLGGFLPQVPLSEVALLTDEAGVDLNAPYSPAVGYFSFATMTKLPNSEIMFTWSVRF